MITSTIWSSITNGTSIRMIRSVLIVMKGVKKAADAVKHTMWN
jgi:hypothetical protein